MPPIIFARISIKGFGGAANFFALRTDRMVCYRGSTEERLMNSTMIFVMQVALNLLIYTFIARQYVMPRLAMLPLSDALIPLLLFHMFRTMGVTFVVPGVVGSVLPPAFATPGAYGDLLAVVLALAAALAVRQRARWALLLVWLFSIVGTADLLYALLQGARFNIAANYHLGPVWFIPTFFVPAFLVTHALVILLLINRSHEYRPATPHASQTVDHYADTL
jgi:hypothetical protein